MKKKKNRYVDKHLTHYCVLLLCSSSYNGMKYYRVFNIWLKFKIPRFSGNVSIEVSVVLRSMHILLNIWRHLKNALYSRRSPQSNAMVLFIFLFSELYYCCSPLNKNSIFYVFFPFLQYLVHNPFSFLVRSKKTGRAHKLVSKIKQSGGVHVLIGPCVWLFLHGCLCLPHTCICFCFFLSLHHSFSVSALFLPFFFGCFIICCAFSCKIKLWKMCFVLHRCLTIRQYNKETKRVTCMNHFLFYVQYSLQNNHFIRFIFFHFLRVFLNHNWKEKKIIILLFYGFYISYSAQKWHHII